MPHEPDLSLVVPLFNEEENVRPLLAAIAGALEPIGRTYEVVLVDDGSTDGSRQLAKEAALSQPGVRLVVLRRNYGQTAAMAAGVRHARGRIIVTMDGDLQNDPADIPRLVALVDGGCDIVVGWRRRRKDSLPRVIISRFANRIISAMMGVQIHDSGCSLKAYRAELIQNLPLYGEMHRFIPALSGLAGARLAEIEVTHHPRRFGVSKYGYSRIIKVMLDIASIRVLLSFARRPLLWHGAAGGALALTTLLVLAWSFGFSRDSHGQEATIAMLLMSLTLFLFVWGAVAQIVALTSRSTARYASVAADLALRAQRRPSEVPS
jgi:glycosyltransferase involved in cell wall biosynthesis